jgi:hypothetical protein
LTEGVVVDLVTHPRFQIADALRTARGCISLVDDGLTWGQAPDIGAFLMKADHWVAKVRHLGAYLTDEEAALLGWVEQALARLWADEERRMSPASAEVVDLATRRAR